MHMKLRRSLKNNQQNFVNIWCNLRCFYAAFFAYLHSFFKFQTFALTNILPTMLYSCYYFAYVFYISFLEEAVWDFFASTQITTTHKSFLKFFPIDEHRRKFRQSSGVLYVPLALPFFFFYRSHRTYIVGAKIPSFCTH